MAVKFSALKTAIMMVVVLDESERPHLLDLLTLMFQVLGQAVQERDNEVVNDELFITCVS